MVNYKYDKVLQVDIGESRVAPANFVTITNVVYFAEKVVSPDGDLVDPLSMINGWNPAGVHQNHKYWELTLCLDTDWYPDVTPGKEDEYWAYYQDVDGAGGKAIDEDGPNMNIKEFVVHLREHDGTYIKLTYASADANVLWCTGETSEFSNETGERHQRKTFKFICLQERLREEDVIPVVDATGAAGKVKRIANVRTGGADSVNILGFKEDFVMRMTPQFIPNYYPGVGLKQDEKYRVITVVVDSETDIFDLMIKIKTAQVVAVTDFKASFVMDDTAGTIETWTYSPGQTYMMKREEGRINEATGRETIEYVFISYGTKGVSQA